jgi:GNAT superfamily N-acetyltransferase
MNKNNTEIRIRPAIASDIDQLCKIRNNPTQFERYLEECDGERCHFLVAEVNGAAVGFGLVYLDVTKTGRRKALLPKLSDLYVDEQYRGRGVGSALILARETLAEEYGHVEIFVSIDPEESPEMIRLAKKLGYAPIQAEPYWTTGVFYDRDDKPYEKRYSRIDFRKNLKRTCA